jgi:hypothetical protein
MDTLEDRFWDFAQDRLPYSVYDALYTFAGHAYTVFRSVNNVVTWLYKSAYVSISLFHPRGNFSN